MKTIEDDPSITPGSVARSPLSISAAKETDLFAPSSKTSPTDIPPLSLSSSTWSFNPTGSSSQPHFTRFVNAEQMFNNKNRNLMTFYCTAVPRETIGPMVSHTKWVSLSYGAHQ